MNTNTTTTKTYAFTLIELLVVIAIIGILAGLLFPAIKGVLDKSIALRIANNGKNIVTQIIAENLERESLSLATVWPSKDKWPTSNAYFAALVESQVLDDVSVFSGAGVSAAEDVEAFKTGNGNLWNCIAGISARGTDAAPFMYTRNLTGVTESELTTTDFMSTKQWEDTMFNDSSLNPSLKPFGDARLVIVTAGSAANIIQRKHLSSMTFLNGASFTNATAVASMEVLTAIDTGEATSSDF